MCICSVHYAQLSWKVCLLPIFLTHASYIIALVWFKFCWYCAFLGVYVIFSWQRHFQNDCFVFFCNSNLNKSQKSLISHNSSELLQLDNWVSWTREPDQTGLVNWINWFICPKRSFCHFRVSQPQILLCFFDLCFMKEI